MKSTALTAFLCLIPIVLAAEAPTFLAPSTDSLNTAVLGYVWADRASASSYAPDPDFSYNASGGDIEIERSAVGTYTVRFLGSGQPTLGGHVQVTPYGSENRNCRVLGWGSDGSDFLASVRCFNADGVDEDSQFSMLTFWPEEGTPGLSYAWADDPDNDAYAADAAYAYNAAGGDIDITRSSAGRYTVHLPNMAVGGGFGGHVQVSAYGSEVGICKTTGWNPNGANIDIGVRCFDPSGTDTDLLFNVLFVWPTSQVFGLGYVWAFDAEADSYNATGGYSYNSAGGDVAIARASMGTYTVTFEKLGIATMLGANVQVTSYGSDTSSCRVRRWDPNEKNLRVLVRCFDVSGALTDALFDALVMWPDSPFPPVSDAVVGYALIDQPDVDVDTLGSPRSYNSAEDIVVSERMGIGSYKVRFVGLADNGAGGNVQVTPYGGNHHCSIDGWDPEVSDLAVLVHCFDPDGAAVDGRFSLLVVWPDEPNPAIGYAWANESDVAEYSPSEAWAYNGSGGEIVMTRSAPGTYKTRFVGLGRDHSGGNVQVSAYGEGNTTCTVPHWASQTDFVVDVDCFDPGGAPTDSRYTVLVTWPDHEDPRVGYVWANESETGSYEPHGLYALNGSGGSITITRDSLGRYAVLFSGLGSDVDGGNVQVTAYSSSNHCSVDGWESSDGADLVVRVNCYDADGNASDELYTVLVNWPDRSSATAIEDPTVPDAGFGMSDIYPNPTSLRATVEFTTKEPGDTSVELFDVTGRRIAVVIDGLQPAGSHILQFELPNVPSGNYIAVLRHSGGSVARKFTVVR